MSSRIRKILKHTVIAVLSLAVLFLVLNLFLTGRLERYLKRELIERTANATDGFYRLSFDKLSISFFKGELRLEGISLEPDSKVFEHWAALDSLPDTYVSTRIEVIDFKGINLVWRWNYRQLHFNTFEIRSPEVRVYGSSGSNPLDSGPAGGSGRSGGRYGRACRIEDLVRGDLSIHRCPERKDLELGKCQYLL